MEKSINTWYELLHFIGGKLETDKCEWYHISWDFDENDKLFMKQIKDKLIITSPQENKIESTRLQVDKSSTYLGITSRVNGKQLKQQEIGDLPSGSLCNSYVSGVFR